MLIHSLILSAAAILLVLKPVLAVPTPIYHEDGSVEIQFNHSTIDGSIIPRSIALVDFKGCTPDMREALTASWINMVEMGSKIKGNIEFNEAVAVDFFGEPSKNSGYQAKIRGQIEGVAEWSPDGSSPELRLVCAGQPIPDDPGTHCLPGTPTEDFHKCDSRCWKRVKSNIDGRLQFVSSKVDAFTFQRRRRDGGNIVATMSFCPPWFEERKPCLDRYNQWKGSQNARRDLTNYQCREQVMVHELFHVDAHWQKFAPGLGHVEDAEFEIIQRSWNGKNVIQKVVTRKAYGPYFTKVFARLQKAANGEKVARNADNLAFYFLAKWIELHGRYRVDQPDIGADKPFELYDPPTKRQEPSDQPELDRTGEIDDGRTLDVWDPLKIDNGEVTIGDLDDLARVLHVGSQEEALAFANPDEEPCSDLIQEGETDEEVVCNDEGNVPVKLDGSTGVLPSLIGDGGLPGSSPTEYPLSPGAGTQLPPAPTAPPSPPPPPPPAGPDTGSPAYEACGNKLGASSCPGSDNQCIIDQCKNDPDCQASRFDCGVFGK